MVCPWERCRNLPEAALAENDAGLLNITVNVSGGLAEIVALDESSDFIGMVPLNTRTDLDVRALIRGGRRLVDGCCEGWRRSRTMLCLT